MKKFGIILAMTAAVIIVYLIITLMQPVINAIVATANASANWTGFESTQGAINAFPIYIWVLPGAIYLIAITLYLKFGET
jgi:archaellum biogenesis protein FlaJ (TadC family)